MRIKSIFNLIAATSIALAAIASCEPQQEYQDSLSVEPADAISFLATGNEDVILTVTTNVEDWTFTSPEWITARQEGNLLHVNALDNKNEERLGRVTVTAGKAEPVRINVRQYAADGEGEDIPGETVSVKLNAVSEQMVNVKSELQGTLFINISTEEPAAKDITVNLSYDSKYLEEFNYIQHTDCRLFPEEKVSFIREITIKAGETQSENLEIGFDAEPLDFGTGYLIPLRAKADKNSGIVINNEDSRTNFIVERQQAKEKEVRNVVYFECNDVNPLNALEYVLEDGTPFFDAVILFSANINYNSEDDVVYLHNNPNIQALLDETDTYIQPLRKKGIKVYLGLLGNHDAAGLCQLSDYGAQQWADEVARAVRDYRLDGVNLDDEYSNMPLLSSKWFAPRGVERGARLLYELRKAMNKYCTWKTDISYYDRGEFDDFIMMYPCEVQDLETGESFPASHFIDFHVPNYGGASSYPVGDLTKKNCAYVSIQCNESINISESAARTAKEKGYGWIMWFAFNPNPQSANSNLSAVWDGLNGCAKGLYEQEVRRPAGYYYKDKNKEGEFDPERHPLDF